MQKQGLNYEDLFMNFKKGLRNGNWRKLNFIDKALFRASLWYVKNRCIVNIFYIFFYQIFAHCKQKFRYMGWNMKDCCKWIFNGLEALYQWKQNLKR